MRSMLTHFANFLYPLKTKMIFLFQNKTYFPRSLRIEAGEEEYSKDFLVI